jgi:hypothetical protein
LQQQAHQVLGDARRSGIKKPAQRKRAKKDEKKKKDEIKDEKKKRATDDDEDEEDDEDDEDDEDEHEDDEDEQDEQDDEDEGEWVPFNDPDHAVLPWLTAAPLIKTTAIAAFYFAMEKPKPKLSAKEKKKAPPREFFPAAWHMGIIAHIGDGSKGKRYEGKYYAKINKLEYQVSEFSEENYGSDFVLLQKLTAPCEECAAVLATAQFACCPAPCNSHLRGSVVPEDPALIRSAENRCRLRHWVGCPFRLLSCTQVSEAAYAELTKRWPMQHIFYFSSVYAPRGASLARANWGLTCQGIGWRGDAARLTVHCVKRMDRRAIAKRRGAATCAVRRAVPVARACEV